MKLPRIFGVLLLALIPFLSYSAMAQDLTIGDPTNLQILIQDNLKQVTLTWSAPESSTAIASPERYAVFWNCEHCDNGRAVASYTTSITLSFDIISNAGPVDGRLFKFGIRSDNDTLHLYSGFVSADVQLGQPVEVLPVIQLETVTAIVETPTVTPDPTPSPTPQALPAQTPDPAPIPPAPDPAPIPPAPISAAPAPDPIPAPDPAPLPEPASQPAPDPAPDPQPAPDPKPDPDPIPASDPQLDPIPAPAPAPDPIPAPDPAPLPEPASQPAPEIIPGLISNNPDQLPDAIPKEAPPEALVVHIQEDKAGVENGGIEFFGTKSQPQVIGEDGKLTPPAPAPGSGDPIPADAITTVATFEGQPGGTTFNAPDIAVPVEPIQVNINIPGVGQSVQALANAYVAMANIGNDMSPITRKKAKKVLIATIMGGQILRRRIK